MTPIAVIGAASDIGQVLASALVAPGRPVLRVISADVFWPIGVGAIRRTGVAAPAV